jgi:hypothetical protein
MLLTFRGPRPKGMLCRHLDSNPKNNKIGNLRWGTQSENMRDAGKLGRMSRALKGENGGNAKLTNKQAFCLRWAANTWGLRGAVLARRLGVSRQTVNNAIAGRTFTEVAFPHCP